MGGKSSVFETMQLNNFIQFSISGPSYFPMALQRCPDHNHLCSLHSHQFQIRMKSNTALILLGLAMLVAVARASLTSDVKECSDMLNICMDNPQRGRGISYEDCPKILEKVQIRHSFINSSNGNLNLHSGWTAPILLQLLLKRPQRYQ